MKKRLLFSIVLLLICFFVFPGTVSADEELYVTGTCGENLTWILEENRLIIDGDGPMYDYCGSVAPWSEYADSIFSVFIENGITTVGSGAFQNSKTICRIRLPDSLIHIGDYAFNGCTKLVDLTIDSQLEYIGEYAFAGCTELNRLYISGSIQEIKTGAFSGDSKLTDVQMLYDVEVIGKEAFLNCDISELKMPASITNIGENAFSGNTNLSEITFKGPAPNISANAFTGVTATAYYSTHEDSWTSGAMQNYGGTLTWKEKTFWTDSGYCGTDASWYYDEVDGYLLISGTNELDSRRRGWAIYRDSIQTVVVEEGITGVVGGFEDCVALKNVSLPSTVTGLDGNAFAGCVSLTEITLPDSITQIGWFAFEGCTKLKNITLPVNLTTIGSWAFKDCTAFTQITLPKNVNSIGHRVFWGCSNLHTITVDKNNPNFVADQWGVLYTKDMTQLLEAPPALLTGDYMIPSPVTTINSCAFYGCNTLTSVSMADSVTSICMQAFMNCTALREVNLSANTYEIPDQGFVNCSSMTEITIPASVTLIYPHAFEGCTGLVDVYFEGDAPVGEISGDAFPGINAAGHYTPNETWTENNRQRISTSLRWIVPQLETPIVEESNVASSGKIKLEWQAIHDVQAYEVYRRAGKTGSFKLIATTENNYLTDKNVTAGTVYYYKVRAIHNDSEMNSEFSAVVSQTCDLPRPVVTESNDTATGKIKLKWDKISGAEEYKIYRRVGKTGDYEYYKTTTSTSYTDKSTTAGTVYYYQVLAVHENTSANSAKSAGVGQTCKLARPEIEETNDTATGKVKLTWDKIDGAKEYKIYRRVGKDGDYKSYKTVSTNKFTDTDNTAGTVYYYKVTAIHSNSSANSAQSAGVGQTCKLAQPVIEETNDTSTGKVKLTWDKIEGAKEYKIYRRVGKTGDYEYYKTTTSNSYTDKSTTAGTAYYYKVTAIHSNSSANSAKSAGVGQTCKLARPDVTISLSSGNPKLTWDEIEGAEKYEVYRATSKSGTYTKVKSTTSLKFTDKDVTEGKTYYYKVKAIHDNSNANSAYSSVDSITAK